MAIPIPAVVQDDLRSEQPHPIWCVEIDTGAASPATIYLTSREHAVTFGAQSFSTRPIAVGTITLQGAGAGASSELKIADADDYWNTLVAAGADPRGREVRLRFTVAAATGAGSSTSDSKTTTWICDGVERTRGEVVLKLVPLVALFDRKIPRNVVTRQLAPGIPPAGAFF